MTMTEKTIEQQFRDAPAVDPQGRAIDRNVGAGWDPQPPRRAVAGTGAAYTPPDGATSEGRAGFVDRPVPAGKLPFAPNDPSKG
jgi:hypothetical protein